MNQQQDTEKTSQPCTSTNTPSRVLSTPTSTILPTGGWKEDEDNPCGLRIRMAYGMTDPLALKRSMPKWKWVRWQLYQKHAEIIEVMNCILCFSKTGLTRAIERFNADLDLKQPDHPDKIRIGWNHLIDFLDWMVADGILVKKILPNGLPKKTHLYWLAGHQEAERLAASKVEEAEQMNQKKPKASESAGRYLEYRQLQSKIDDLLGKEDTILTEIKFATDDVKRTRLETVLMDVREQIDELEKQCG